jgi:surface polysaccharide O-acyltransferase-like enzyme
MYEKQKRILYVIAILPTFILSGILFLNSIITGEVAALEFKTVTIASSEYEYYMWILVQFLVVLYFLRFIYLILKNGHKSKAGNNK